MSFNRRNFLSKLGTLAGTVTAGSLLTPALANNLERAFESVAHLSLDECASNEEFWYQIKMAYTVSPSLLNLNNGGVSPQPKVVQDAVERYNKLSNESPSYYMWRVLDRGRDAIRVKLADLAGCSPEEIAINRNSSEALETVIFGLRLKAGDEVILSKQDYPNMINAWKQRAHREGIVLKWLNFDYPIEDKAAIVDTFKNAFTPKTKILHLTHMINWCGQLLPAKEIIQEAHDQGIEVLLDAAHTFAHIDYNIPDLGCDYFGTSLHKWLCAPFGSGMLYVKKEKIKNLYPLFGAPDPEEDNIRKFENLGTRSGAIEQAIGQAVDFHHLIGAERKQKRLFHLKNYWTEKLADLPQIKIHTPKSDAFSGAICLCSIDGMESVDVANILQSKYHIHVVGINWENLHGIRVTPNVYTVTKDLDRFVEAMREIVLAEAKK
ncbi:MAG: selenocysteine lyase/cysteine desulfurase [Saprospiraceae bacterium]|jgi:selenocysteine lyase/cysteine desulfurase